MSKIVLTEEPSLPGSPGLGKAQLFVGTDGYLYLGTGDGEIVQLVPMRPALTVTSAESPHAVSNLDGALFLDASAGAVVVNLPQGGEARPEGYLFKAVDATNAVTLTPAGAETIDGAASLVLAAYEVARLAWNGSEWSRL